MVADLDMVSEHGRGAMRHIVVSSGSGSNEPRYTHLTAWVIEEEDGYVVQVRLHHEMKPANAAWGEEISDSLEMASALLHALAAKFSIPQSRVDIRLRLENLQDGTRH
jgi:hypothetical protein